MTEYELGEMLYNTYDGLWQGSQMYFTLVSAYLIVAYLVGAKLNRTQNAIVTGLYCVWTIGIIQSQYSTSIQMIGITGQLLSSNASFLPTDVGAQTQAGVYSFLVVQMLGLLASLYFMWSVRHPKTE
jgi:hypothetical protein